MPRHPAAEGPPLVPGRFTPVDDCHAGKANVIDAVRLPPQEVAESGLGHANTLGVAAECVRRLPALAEDDLEPLVVSETAGVPRMTGMNDERARRGRPRSEASRLAVLEATAGLLRSKHYDDLTIEGIAAASGVAKTTIYRRWASKAEIVRDATLSGALRVGGLEVGDTGDLRADLLAWALGLRQEAFDPDQMSLARAVLSADLDAVGHSTGGYIGVWDDRHLIRRLRTAAEGGVIEPREDFSAAAASLSHTLAIRILAGAQPSEQWCEDLVDLVLRGLSG